MTSTSEELPWRIVTIPNAISAARLAGVPVFLWLLLGPRTATADLWAVGLLILSGASDWLDGKIARALNQQSRLGEVLDPAADRLYIAATVVALAVRAIIGWWLVILLAARELVLAVVLALLRRRGYPPPQVSFVGKTATLCLLYAFPLLLLGSHPAGYAEVARVAGWAFAIWGSALYWCAALLYGVQARRLLAGDAVLVSGGQAPPGPPAVLASGGQAPPDPPGGAGDGNHPGQERPGRDPARGECSPQ